LFLAFVGVDNLETMPMQTLEIEEAMTSFQNEPEPAIPTEESPPPEILREKTLRLDDFAQVLYWLHLIACCGFQKFALCACLWNLLKCYFIQIGIIIL
jgi:hypothetical protein